MAKSVMPLLDDNLSIWKISFRWAGLDPDSLKYRFYIPEAAKDNIRLILNELMYNTLYCNTLIADEFLSSVTQRDRDNLDLIIRSISHNKYDRFFLQDHAIYRADFAHWCNRSGIPYPEFWFPARWVIHELQEKDRLIGKDNRTLTKAYLKDEIPPIQNESGKRFDAEESIWKPAKIAAQAIWLQNKDISIAGVIKKIKEMPELKASSFSESAIRKNIAYLSPTPGKPGRKPSKKLT